MEKNSKSLLWLVLAAVVILILGGIYWQKKTQGDGADQEMPPEVVTKPVTMLPGDSDAPVVPKVSTGTPVRPPGPPADDGASGPPSIIGWNVGRMMDLLKEIQALPEEEKLERIKQLLDSSSAQERALGGIAAVEEGILTEEQLQELAGDQDPLVPLQVMGWLRDGLSGDAALSDLQAAFRGREDFSVSSLKIWLRGRETTAASGRALLDLMSGELASDQYQSELRQLAFGGAGAYGNSDVQIESSLRLAELVEPLAFSQQLSQAMRRIEPVEFPQPTAIAAPGTPEAQQQQRQLEAALAAQDYEAGLRAQSSRYVKPPQILEAEGVTLGPTDLTNAWNVTRQRDLDLIASIVERAVVSGQPVVTGSSATLVEILGEAATLNPMQALTSEQAYAARRIEAAIPQLSSLETAAPPGAGSIPPGAAPPGVQ